MKTSNNYLKNFEAITPDVKCYEVTEFTKKELTNKDCYYLRYCLMRFILNNQGMVYEFMDSELKELYYDVDEEASICDNSLCIGSFEGYRISEHDSLKSLELSTENRVILNVYNDIMDSYKNYLID